MITLVVDSCTDRGLVSFVEDGKVSYMAGLPFGLHNSRYLVPKIDEGLESIHKEPKDIDLIVSGVGPGSYTGIRAGVVVAKSLSYANQTPLVGICSLEGFIPDHDGIFSVLIDAKMAGCYMLKGECKEGHIVYTSSPEVWLMEHIGEQLDGVEVIVSPHCDVLKNKFKLQYPDKEWKWQETAPNPQYMAKRAEEKYKKGEYSTDGAVEILYMR